MSGRLHGARRHASGRGLRGDRRHPRARRRRAAHAHARGAGKADRRARAARVRLGLDRRVGGAGARTWGACDRDLSARFQSRRDAKPARQRGGERARRAAHAGRRARGRALAGEAARRIRAWPPDVAIVYGPYLPRPDVSPAARLELEAWFRSLAPEGVPRVDRLSEQERPSGPSDRGLPASRADRSAGLLHRRERLHRALGLGACALPRCPATPRTGRWRSTCCAPATQRCSCRRAAVWHSHDYTTLEYLRRCFDEWRGLREVYGWREPASPVHLAGQLRGALGQAQTRVDPPGRARRASSRDARGGQRSPCCPPRRRVARLARRPASERRAAGAVAGGAGKLSTDGRPGDRSHVTSMNNLDGTPRGPFASLRRRIRLTYHYFGWRTLLFRALTFPLRFTPLKHRLRLRSEWGQDAFRRAVAWYREHGEPVDIVIPSYRDAERVGALVASIQRTVPRGLARIIVTDDASGPEHVSGPARDRRHRDHRRGGEPGIRRQCQSWPARYRPRPRRGRAELRHRGPPWLACLPSVRRPPGGRCRHRRRKAGLPRRAHPVRRYGTQPRCARVVRPSLPIQAGELGARLAARSGARRHGSLHVRAARVDRAGGAARRGLPHGL